ncbi:7036_t:CDS:2, partial [Funneliformis geosporum]
DDKQWFSIENRSRFKKLNQSSINDDAIIDCVLMWEPAYYPQNYNIRRERISWARLSQVHRQTCSTIIDDSEFDDSDVSSFLDIETYVGSFFVFIQCIVIMNHLLM